MFKKYRILKWIGLFILTLIVVVVSFGFWFKSLIPPKDTSTINTTAANIPYLSEKIVPHRGKILAVVTSAATMGKTNKSTGYELTELARAYYTFKANGFEVDIASPEGGKPPVVIDDDDMGPYDFAFLNDSLAQFKTSHTLKVDDVVAEEYQAIFFVGGKGAMFDLPNNISIQSLVKDYYQNNKVIGAVCHGPAALVNVVLDNGQLLLKDKTVSGFTNKEELLLIKDAKSIFPFLLQDKMMAQGASFQEGPMYLAKVSKHENIVTGQNPWSTWDVANSMIQQLGYTPKHREPTDEENAVEILLTYKYNGKEEARQRLKQLVVEEQKPLNRVFIAQHSLVSAMKGEVGNFFNMIGLVAYAKSCEAEQMKI
ncbi:type 1 glutamine amidotransferase domain-containing protein [Eudoraea chungangensis]|uniref:type 1 glutamine amidotransferase domain-containing protein n=1 Tax=Eudoraea chungangensis TaxID=1481905 RepID=UPI0023EB2654|nr:type 1 glutamine amidotransferase domain-containing protein [Eudoraea chungangensis]